MISKQVPAAVYLILCISLAGLQCSMDIAGGGTEDVNTKTVVGSIYDTNNQGSPNTQVALIPIDYNPVLDGPIPKAMLDTTDAEGGYQFEILYRKEYNVQAVNLDNGTRVLVIGIAVENDCTSVPAGILKQGGTVTLYLPGTIDTSQGYVFITGTTISQSLSEATSLNDGGYVITLDSVPEATFAAISYDKLNDSAEPISITDTISVIANDTTATEAFVFWANYTKDNSHIPDNHVFDIHIGSDGIVWVGTRQGLARFDGNSWEIFNTSNSGLPGNLVFEIAGGTANRIWLATSGGAAAFDGNTWTTYTVQNSDIPSNLVTNVVEDNNGNIWVSMYGGIAYYNGVTWTAYTTGNSELPSNDVTFLSIDTDGSIWFSSYKGVGRFDGSAWTIYDSLNSMLPMSQTCRVMIDSHGTKWFGHCFGLITRFDGSSWIVYDSTNSNVLRMGHIYEIMESTNGVIWVGTRWGMTRFNTNGTTWTDYIGDKYKLLEHNTVYSIQIDSGNNIWVGTDKNGVVAFGPTIQ